jgi:hypothetical protein
VKSFIVPTSFPLVLLKPLMVLAAVSFAISSVLLRGPKVAGATAKPHG